MKSINIPSNAARFRELTAVQASVLSSPTPGASYEVAEPAAGTELGQRVKLYVKPTVQCSLTVNGDILIPDESLASFPKTLTANKTYIVGLEWNGTAWMLTTLIGGC